MSAVEERDVLARVLSKAWSAAIQESDDPGSDSWHLGQARAVLISDWLAEHDRAVAEKAWDAARLVTIRDARSPLTGVNHRENPYAERISVSAAPEGP